MKNLNERVDTITAAELYAAQLLQVSHGAQTAARFLAKRDIGIDVALRVLTRPPAARPSPAIAAAPWFKTLIKKTSTKDHDATIILRRRLVDHAGWPVTEAYTTENSG